MVTEDKVETEITCVLRTMLLIFPTFTLGALLWEHLHVGHGTQHIEHLLKSIEFRKL